MACVIVALLATGTRVRAEVPDLDADAHEIIERRGVMVPMRDGVRLALDIYLPKSAEPQPILLTISPYGRGGELLRAKARWFAERGYVTVTADSRGRYDSEGDWDPFSSHHKTDGSDLVEWLARQSWSNGRVGMWGTSYAGWVQWWTASEATAHLEVIAPVSAPADQFESGPYQDGALTGGWMPDWAASMTGRVIQVSEGGSYGGWGKRRLEDFRRTPYERISTFRGIENADWLSNWYRQNKSTDPYWSRIAYQGPQQFSRMTVPALNVTGWFDVSHAGAPANYMGLRKFGATPRARRPSLIIGPWVHSSTARITGGIDYGPQASFDVRGYQMRWFDHFLKEIDNGVEADAPVHLFVMGRNEWRTAQDWPLPEAKVTKYFFTSRGHANSLKGDGSLTIEPPAHSSSDTYIYDPRNPTLDPSANNPNHNGNLDGAVDTRLSSIGDDVLVYQTPPLKEAVEVIGPIETTLYASTSAKDTDWMVRLVDVQPDGRSLLLADGVIRARSRDPQNDGEFNGAQLSTIEPGRVYQYKVRFWRGTANLFRQGHRIRVEVSSSWFPFFLPNLNTGADNVASVPVSKAVVAKQRILHGAQFPSHISLPVIPASSFRSSDRS